MDVRKTALLLPCVAVSAGLACNGITGVGDLQLVECAGPSCVDPASTDFDSGLPIDRPRDSGTTTPDVETPQPDAGLPDTGPSTPTYCSGVTFYLPYENNTTATIPAATAPAVIQNGNPSYEAGKFGQAARFTDQLHFYANATNNILNPAVGSFSVWFKPLFNLTNEPRRYFLRPRNNNNTGNGGPALTIEDERVMMQVVDDGSPTATLDPTQTQAAWSTTAYMLMIGTWNRTAPAGTPSLSITLYAPTQKLEATYTLGPWTPEANNAAYFRIGNNAAAVFDEITIWNRVLSKTDMDQLAAATKAYPDACP